MDDSEISGCGRIWTEFLGQQVRQRAGNGGQAWFLPVVFPVFSCQPGQSGQAKAAERRWSVPLGRVEKAGRFEAGSGLVLLQIPPGEESGVRGGQELAEPMCLDPFGVFGGEAIAAGGGKLHDKDAAADDQAIRPVADPAGELFGQRRIDLGGLFCFNRFGSAGPGLAGDDFGHFAAQVPPEIGGIGAFEFRAKAGAQMFESGFAEWMFAGRFPGTPGAEAVVGRIADDPGADRIELDIDDAVDDGLGFEDDAFEAALPKGAAPVLVEPGAVEPAGERMLDGFDELADVAQFLRQIA